MAELTVNSVVVPIESAPAPSAANNKPSALLGATVPAPPAKSEHDPVNDTTKQQYGQPADYWDEVLSDAERLLKYAAETGVAVDVKARDYILEARATQAEGWTEETAANLLTALTTLTQLLKPVTAESLRASKDQTGSTVRSYWIVAVCLTCIIVPFSLVSFLATAISNAIRSDITTANELAVKLRAQLGPPPAKDQAAAATAAGAKPAPLPVGLNDTDVITELQQYASTIRAIDARARQLNTLVLGAERDPFASKRNNPTQVHDTFELPEGLPDFAAAAGGRTQVYQDVRYFAQNVLDNVSFFYGAITTCILPVLYALLGTCAYLLRSFDQQIVLRTFMPSVANSARFLIAAIGGAVVGLFNNFTITQGASIPPLAIAFLVGYAVDVFFSFLESLLQVFTKNRGTAASPATS